MSRKFNTKKFIKDVLNDRYALVIGNEIIFDTKEPTDHQRTAMQSVAEVLFYSSFGAPLLLHRSFPSAVKKMASYSHTLPCCVSQLRSSLEASKKQLRIWLQYVCGVTEAFFYSSFGAPLVFLRSPYDDSKMARNGFEEGSKVYASNSVELS